MKVLFTYHYRKDKITMVKNLGFSVIYKPEKEIVFNDAISDI